jgi:ParB/RepB/Spo0J family partition protein
MKKNQQDVLVGRRVEINEGFPYAGARGVIVKPVKGSGYEINLPTGGENGAPITYTYAMSDFTVLHDEVASGEPGVLVDADPHLVAFSLTNPRRRTGLDIESLNSLAASIKVHSVLEPIVVRPLPGSRAVDTFADREEGQPLPIYELVCGERRLRSSRLAGLATMPMVLRHLTDDQAVEMQLVENLDREDLDPIEEAEGFKLLQERLGYTGEQIAERIGKGRGKDYVYKSMKLLELTPESQQAVVDKHLGRSTALLVARYPAAQQAQVVAFIKSLAAGGEPAPFRRVSTEVFRRFNLALSKAVWQITDETLVAAAGACTACPKRTSAQANIFGDEEGSDDSCTDPDCFEGKRVAHVERVKAQAKKEGLEVIDGEEAKKALPSPHMSWIMGYERLDARAGTETGNDDTEREVTFADALRAKGKKAPKPQLLINPHTGEGVKVIPKELAHQLQEEIEEKNGGGERPTDRRGRHMEPHVDERPEDLKALDERNVRRAVLFRVFDAVRSRGRTDAEVLLIAKALFASDGDGCPQFTCEYLQWADDYDGHDFTDIVNITGEKLDALPAADVAAIATMAAIELAQQVLSTDWSALLPIATTYGVDVLAVRDKVDEDLQRQQAGDSDADQDEEQEGSQASTEGEQDSQSRRPPASWIPRQRGRSRRP